MSSSAYAEEIYPEVNLPENVNKTEYGDKENYSEIKYYKWQTNEVGAKVLVEGTADDNDLKYYVSSKKDKITDISQIITENQNGGDIDTNIIDLSLDSKHNAINNAVNYEIGKITTDIVDSGDNVLIYNNGNINSIDVTAIHNNHRIIQNNKDSNITNITGTFIGNSNDKGLSLIGNEGQGTIQSIKGTFTGNRMTGNNVWGTAIRNLGQTVTSIEGVFIDNYNSSRGGAIANSGVIGSIKGSFINNYGGFEGSAIWNYGVIDSIEGYFEGNKGTAAIVAYMMPLENGKFNIGSIDGVFVNNDGGIRNQGEAINKINATFLNNSQEAIWNGWRGAVINNLSGHIEGNHRGIFNGPSGNIKNISVDFVKNYTDSDTVDSPLQGGAIYNAGKIGEFDADGNIIGGGISNSTFKGNYAKSETGVVQGGAIYNSGTMGNISADFTGNYAETSSPKGGAIYNTGAIGKITGSFVNNYIKGPGETFGGAICNYSSITAIKGDFIGNKIESAATLRGTAIYTEGGHIGSIEGNFIQNTGTNTGKYQTSGAITNYVKSTIDFIKGDFIKNTLSASNLSLGGAISNFSFSVIKTLDGDFIENGATSTASGAKGGAIFLGQGSKIENIINSSFIGNYAVAQATAEGGAIYVAQAEVGDINIIADNGESIFKGNYTQVGEEKDDNAIYLANGSTLELKSINNGKIELYDNIRGSAKEVVVTDEEGNVVLDEDGNEVTETKNYTVNITGDGSGTFGLYNDIYDANVTLGNTTINTINDIVHTYNFHSLTLTGDTNMAVDVDLAKGEMDRFSANSYGTHQGNLNVVGMNLLSDAPENRPVTEILFAEIGLKDNVTNGIPNNGELPQADYQTTVYTPIYKYNVAYANRDDAGYFMFTKGDRIITPGGGTSSTGNPSDAFNPAVLASPVAAQAGAQATINETFHYAFGHADTFTQLPKYERMANIKSNQYALSTDYNENLGSITSEFNNKAGWFRPYVTFENMHLKNGPKVDAITYGSLVGFDTDFHEHKHGWHSVGTGYIGYNGSQLNYQGVDTTMNGGLLGYTHTMYKGNFWTALTASAGASVGQSTTMYGKEDFTSLLAGVGSKTGYNFEFKEGKYILQPIMFMSYTFVNTFDYTNAAGVKIDNDPMHTIQLNPSVRFIANTKNGWRPYASVGMVWNLMNETNSVANGVKLPEMHTKPYVEYGLGLQKRFKDRFTAFGQAMLRNGGRNGIALTAGFRWALGREGKPIEKVDNGNNLRYSEDGGKYMVRNLVQGASHSEKRYSEDTVRRIQNTGMRSFANAQDDSKTLKQVQGDRNLQCHSEGAARRISNTEQRSFATAQDDSKTLKQVQGDSNFQLIPSPLGGEGQGEGVKASTNLPTHTLAQREMEQRPSTRLKLNIMSQQDILARANGYTNSVGTKKIVKQLTPKQKVVLGAKPQNTTRTTNIGVIK